MLMSGMLMSEDKQVKNCLSRKIFSCSHKMLNIIILTQTDKQKV